MFIVYILFSKDYNQTYKGMTSNLNNRIKQHNSKQNKSTKAYVPWNLIYYNRFETRVEAREHEKYLKSGIGREFIKTLLISPKFLAP
jgi:putative endonuclease